jgi:hypothetical protein
MVENTCVLERRCQTTLKTPFRGVSHCITHVHNSCLSTRAVYPFNYTPGGISCRGNRVAIYLLISISSGPPNKLFIVSNIPCREFFSYEKYLVHVQRILHFKSLFVEGSTAEANCFSIFWATLHVAKSLIILRV